MECGVGASGLQMVWLVEWRAAVVRGGGGYRVWVDYKGGGGRGVSVGIYCILDLLYSLYLLAVCVCVW